MIEALRAKHPPGPEDPFGPNPGPRNGSIPSPDDLINALNSFKPETAPGISSWTCHLVKLAINQSPAVLSVLHTLTGFIAAGKVPAQPMLCSSRLVALFKPDGGYRPIEVGDIIYRLATKAILRHSMPPDFLSSLSDLESAPKWE